MPEPIVERDIITIVFVNFSNAQLYSGIIIHDNFVVNMRLFVVIRSYFKGVSKVVSHLSNFWLVRRRFRSRRGG